MFSNKAKYDFLTAFGGIVFLLATLALITGTVHGNLRIIRIIEAVCGIALYIYANNRRVKSDTWDFLLSECKKKKDEKIKEGVPPPSGE